MTILEILTAAQLGEILGTSAQSIRNSVSRGMEGKSIPPSIKLGGKRRWRRKTVFEWLDEKTAEAQPTKSKRKPGRPRVTAMTPAPT